MPRKPGGYKNEAGRRVIGVTTITGRWGDPGGLMHWANDLGLQGIYHRDVSKIEAEAGNVAHLFIEQTLHGEPLDPKCDNKETVARGRKGFEAYQEWARHMEIEHVFTERDLVSETYQYGGCPDLVAKIHGKLVLLDWKCCNAVYPSAIYQLSGYRQLVDENGLGPIDDVWLCRFEKEFGSFHHHNFVPEQMDLAFAGFVKLLENYELDKRMKSWL